MILRSFYGERTHLVGDGLPTTQSAYAGCHFVTLVTSVVRTHCDQFIENTSRPIVVMLLAETPSCAECREKSRIEAVAAAASAE